MKYIATINTNDIKTIKKLEQKLKSEFVWWKFWKRIIIVSEGITIKKL